MNKLLQHIMDAGGGTDKFLPYLEQFQTKGQYNGKSPLLQLAARQAPVYDNIPHPAIFQRKAMMDMESRIAQKNAEAKRIAEDKAIVEGRKKRIAASIEAQKKPFSAQQLADETQATGDKFRIFPEDPHSFIDDWLNPGVFIGNMASGLGRVPLNIQQGNYGDAAMAVAIPAMYGAGEKLLEPVLKKAGKILTTQTPLKETYRLNPWAFKPKQEMMYRGLGEEGMKDAMQSGVFRPKQQNYAPGRSAAEKAASEKQFNRTYFTPAETFDVVQNYGPQYIAEVPKSAGDFAKRYGRKNWSWSTERQIPINEGKILQKDWLKGYKELPKPDKYQAFGPNNSNAGLWNFLKYTTTPGSTVNPVGIVKDYSNGIMLGAAEAIKGGLQKAGMLSTKVKARPLSEIFPVTKAQKQKVMQLQDESLADAKQFINDYWYGNSDDLRPVLEEKMRAILPELKMAKYPKNLERSKSPIFKTPDRLITNTTWGTGREGLSEDVISYLNKRRGELLGVNTDEASITLRNRGPFYQSPRDIGQTVVHESGHSAQNMGVLGDFKQKQNFAVNQPWGEVTTVYDPNLEYFTSNPNTELGRRFKEALVEPKKGSSYSNRKQTWRSSPNELHSELLASKYNLYKQGLRQGYTPEEMIQRVTDPGEKELNWLLNSKTINKHFKKGTSKEEKLALLKLLPAAVPVVAGASMLDEKEEGGETPEYKGHSIVDYLATRGYAGKKAFRKGLAEQYGVENYDYSAAKNLELLAKIRENDDLLEANKQDFDPVSVQRIEEMHAARQSQQPSTEPITRAIQEQKDAEKNKAFNNLRRRMTLELGYDPFLEGPKVPKINAPKFSLSSKSPYGKNSLVNGLQGQGSMGSEPIPGPAKQPVPVPQARPAVQPAPQPAPAVQPVAETGWRFDKAPVPNTSTFYPFQQFPPFPTKQMAQLPKGRTAQVAAKELEKESDDRAWYEKAWDAFSQAVNNNQVLRGGNMTIGGAGFTPQGATQMSRDLTRGVLSLVSDDLLEKYDNKMQRQDAKLNPNERKSSFDPAKVQFDPVYVTGDTIPDGKRRYHIPEIMDLDYMRFGVRNRGDLREIQTEGAPITTFEPFQSSKQYFAKTKDPANATYIGVAPDGRIKVGGRDQFQDQDYQVTRTFGNKVVDFNRDKAGSIVKVPSNPKASKETLSPSVKVLDDNGKVVDGKLSLLLPRAGNQEESFDLVTGGRYIFQTPDGKTKLVSGSLKNIETEFYNMKKNHPWINVITLDNGSYARGIRTFDQKLTKQDLKGYDNQNTGGGNFAYILPGERKTRYESKFTDFEAAAQQRLQSLYPGKKVSIAFQNTGLYDKTGGRDIESQVGIQKRGNSQTPVSLHNFGAAKDYILIVDGKELDPEVHKKVYKDVLWNSADKTGLYHLEDWDPAHISLAKEGQKTAFDELYAKYPDLFANPTFIRSLNYVNKNKSNPIYEEYFELLNNIQPFTGKPRTTEVMKRNTAKKQSGGPIVDPRGQWAYPGMDTVVPSPTGEITMQGVPYPVYGQDETGYGQMMYPGGEYSFPGQMVYERPMMQKGGQKRGLWNTDKKTWVDSVHNANLDRIDFVKRLFDQSRGSIQVPGERGTSTHLMAYDPRSRRVYPEVVNVNGKLIYMPGDAAYNYADSTGQYIKFPTVEQAKWYASSSDTTSGYKMGTGVLRGFAQGGEMIRRADGSYSQRGLWDNIRANKGSGKKPTKEMLQQERKIKAKSK